MRKVFTMCQTALGFITLAAAVGFMCGWLMLIGDFLTPPGEPVGMMFFTPDGRSYFDFERHSLTWGACQIRSVADASGRMGIEMAMSPGIAVPYWSILSTLCLASACLLFLTPWSKAPNQLPSDGRLASSAVN